MWIMYIYYHYTPLFVFMQKKPPTSGFCEGATGMVTIYIIPHLVLKSNCYYGIAFFLCGGYAADGGTMRPS